MSCLNWFTDEARCLVAVDTAGSDHYGEWREQSKVLALPHARMVIAGRGNTAFVLSAFGRAWMEAKNYDEAAERMSLWLSEAIAAAPDHVDLGHEVLIAGWSDSRGRMWAEHFSYREGLSTARAQQWGVAPGDPFTQGLEPPRDDLSMLDVAKRQAAWGRRQPWRDGRRRIAHRWPLARLRGDPGGDQPAQRGDAGLCG